jgi:hypothetical protein
MDHVVFQYVKVVKYERVKCDESMRGVSALE